MIQRIEINFPIPVDLPPGFDRLLDAVAGMVCEYYEAANPKRTMWPAGQGAKPIWNEPEEPTFDDSVYCIDVSEREAYESEIRRREPRRA